MTRINAFIPPENLTDAHLIAEIKEINQLCGSYRKSLTSKNGINNIPEQFTLNSGHVKFFYKRGKYLSNRFEQLKYEALKRGFNVISTFNSTVWKEYHFKDWNPTNIEIERIRNILFERISSRLQTQKKSSRYKKEIINSDIAINLLRQNQ